MKYTVAGLSLLVIGIALLILGGFQGGFLVIFPFIMSTSPLGGLGILLIMLGGILLFIGFATDYNPYEQNMETETRSHGIGVVLIGPIPLIIDTNNRKLTVISMALFAVGIILLVIFLI